MAGVGSPVPLRSSPGVEPESGVDSTRSNSTALARLAIKANGTLSGAERTQRRDHSAIHPPAPIDPNLPQVAPGMFSVLARRDRADDDEASLPPRQNKQLEAEMEKSLGNARRRFLIRPGAESQEALRIQQEQQLALISDGEALVNDEALAMGLSLVQKTKKKASSSSSSTAKAQTKKTGDEPVKRKRGRPPKRKKKGGAVNAGTRQGGASTGVEEDAAMKEAGDAVAMDSSLSLPTCPCPPRDMELLTRWTRRSACSKRKRGERRRPLCPRRLLSAASSRSRPW